MTIPAADSGPDEAAWRQQEEALAAADAAPLRKVLTSPPPEVLPPDFARRVAERALLRARQPSPRFEAGLGLGAGAMLVATLLFALALDPGLGTAIARAGTAWAPVADGTLLTGLLLVLAALWQGRAARRPGAGVASASASGSVR